MSAQWLIPAPGSPEARGLPPDLVAQADCLRQLALQLHQPDSSFWLPYLYHRSRIVQPCESRLLQFRDVAEGIYYREFSVRSHGTRNQLEESARRYLPPGLEHLLEPEYELGRLEPKEVYPRVLRYLLESGFLDRYPELKLQAEAALILGDLL